MLITYVEWHLLTHLRVKKSKVRSFIDYHTKWFLGCLVCFQKSCWVVLWFYMSLARKGQILKLLCVFVF